MGEPLRPLRNRGYPKGLGRRLFAWDIDEGQATLLQNAVTDVLGMTQKRGGTEITATGITHGPILALGSFKPDGDSVLLAISPTHTDDTHRHHRLWEWDGTGTEWSMVAQLTGMTTVTNWECSIIQIYDTTQNFGDDSRHGVLISPGRPDTELRRYAYNGTSLVQANFGDNTGGSVTRHPSTDAVSYAFYRLCGAGSGNTSNRAFVSLPGSILTGDVGIGARSFTMGGDGRGIIIAIKEFRQNEYVIFMDDRTEVLFAADSGGGVFSGVANWTRRTVDPNIGCGSRRSVAAIGQEIYFVDQFGNVRTLVRTIQDVSQGTKSLPISDDIQDYIDLVNKAFLSHTVGWVYDRFYFVAFPLESAIDASHIFRYDTTRGAWDGPWILPNKVKDARVGILDADGADADYKNPTMFVGTDRQEWGEVLALEQGNDDSGAGIAFDVRSKRYTYGDPALKKRWVRVELYAVATEDQDLTVDANVDQTGWVSLGTINLGGGAPLVPQELPFALSGFGVTTQKFSLEGLEPGVDIQFRVTGTTTGEIKLLGHTLTAFPENYEWGEVTN